MRYDRYGRQMRWLVSIVTFMVLWQLGSTSEKTIGVRVPWVSEIPAPFDVVQAWSALVLDNSYWHSWYLSLRRVLVGFCAAMALGIPLGLLMAVNNGVYKVLFPPFEVLRPIPPLAWVPAAIIFWPTEELSIGFITFLGAFYTIVINVVDGANNIDARFFNAARSMGAVRHRIFRTITLPGTVPSIVTGATVAMGITWEVVVAAEMISGGGSTGGGAGGGLGFFIWNSYTGGAYDQIVVGMLSIGVAGYLCSSAIRFIGRYVTAWDR